MVYLLIDTCSLRDLLDVHGYSTYLTELESLIANDSVRWLSHEKVVEEWNKHKHDWGRRKMAKLYSKNRKIDQDNSTTQIVKYEQNHIDIQIDTIDKLIQHNTVLETPEVITNEFATRYSKELAPFHTKKDSLNDWQIIGSLCKYCEVHGIRDIHFKG